MFRIIISVLTLTLCLACGQDKPTSMSQGMATQADKSIPTIAHTVASVYGITPTGETSFGYEYIKHTKNSGELIQTGEYAYFSYYVKMRDSIVGSSIGSEWGVVQIEPTSNAEGKQPSPVMDVLKLMAKGDSVTVYWPTEQVPQVPPQYKDEPFVVYDLVLQDVKSEEQHKAVREEKIAKQKAATELRKKEGNGIKQSTLKLIDSYKKGKLDSQLKTTASGLKYIIHEEGKGRKPAQGKTVLVNYYGFLTDGSSFDDSYKRGQPFNFPLGKGRVIEGWDEGIALFKEGTKATLFVPYQLGYGAAGKPPRIPEKSELVFYVDFEKVYQ